MPSPIKVAVVEDHQGIIDGYHMRLTEASGIQLVGVAQNGEELNDLLEKTRELDVLIMDVHVPTSAMDRNPIPILHYVPHILKNNPQLNILVISMLDQPALVKALAQAGVSGYILKGNGDAIRRLPAILKSVSSGGRYFEGLETDAEGKPVLTNRQLVVLTFCAAYPDLSTEHAAQQLGIAPSTVRNLLSETYERLGVRTKAAAISRAKELGLIP
jgi:two-component system capsular synthesis response regulator RcsB